MYFIVFILYIYIYIYINSGKSNRYITVSSGQEIWLAKRHYKHHDISPQQHVFFHSVCITPREHLHVAMTTF